MKLIFFNHQMLEDQTKNVAVKNQCTCQLDYEFFIETTTCHLEM